MKSLRHAVTLLVPALLALGTGLALLVLAVARRVVTPMRRVTDTEILVVDNFGDLYDKDYGLGDRAISVARQGLSYGVHIITSSNAWLVGQKQALLNVSNARIQLRLSNPDETQMGTGIDHRRAARHTLDRPGFGVSRQGHELLMGVPEISGPQGERITVRPVGAVIAANTGLERVETLARLPERIALRQVIEAFAATPAAADPLNLPFAIGESGLAPVALPLRNTPNLSVIGRQGCGKTSTLAAVGQAIMSRYTPEQAQIGMEAVNQLLVALEVHRFDFCFIGAGYEKEVDEFLTVNPGLAGRFNRKLRFESYSPDELVEIANRYGEPRATVIEPAAQEAMNAACRVLRAYIAPNGEHGVDVMQNGRFARNVVERAERLRDSRVAAQNRTDRGSVTISDLETIRTQDVMGAIIDACAEKNVPLNL